MAFVRFLRSMPGRVLRVVGGALLLWAGLGSTSVAGLLLMMIGLIPIVTAIANVCPLAEAAGVIDRAHRDQPVRPRR